MVKQEQVHLNLETSKTVWVNKDDIILFSKWEFTTDDGKCSIIHKYDIDEAKRLQKEGEFPDTVNLDEENTFDAGDNFTFNYDSGSDSNDEDDTNGEEKDKDRPWWKTQDKDTNDNTDVWQSEKINLDDI